MTVVQPRPKPGRTLAVLLLAAMSFALAQTTVAPAIPDMARELHASVTDVTWTMSGYLVAAAVLTPIIGRLGDMFGKRRVLVLALAIFAAGGVLSAVASQLGLVIAGRVLQGAGGGIFPLCFGIIRDEFPAEKRPVSIGLISAVAGLGGGLGLVIGGLFVDHSTYHWIFWSGAAMAALAAVGTQLLVPESPNRVPGRVDLVGTVLLGIGLALPLLAISEGKTWGWGSARTLGLITGGVAVLALLIAFERRQAEPLIDVPTLALRPVLTTNITTLLVGFGMFGAFLLIPQLAETPKASGYGFGTSATTAGLLMVPGCLTMLITSPLAAVIGRRWGGRAALFLGSVVATIGLVLLASIPGSRVLLLVMCMVMFGGIGLVFAAIPNLIVDAVPPNKTGEATGVNTLLRSVGASLGSQVSASILVSHTGAGGMPTSDAYQMAFAASAIITLVAGLAALTLPRHRGSAGTAASAAQVTTIPAPEAASAATAAVHVGSHPVADRA